MIDDQKSGATPEAGDDTPPEVSESELWCAPDPDSDLGKDLGRELDLDDEELALIFSLGLC